MARRSNSGRGSRGYQPRLVNSRETKQRFLIVCEGEKTEPNYFAALRKDHRLNAIVKVKGVGFDPSNVVDAALDEREKDDYDQVWCVFDRDSWPAQNFNNALAGAGSNNFRVAYSNEAFELWYLLHFDYHDTGITRQQYIAKLEQRLGHRYEKNNPATYGEIRHLQDDALRNAWRLLAEYDPPNPVNDNPSTTVHLLVEELLRHSR